MKTTDALVRELANRDAIRDLPARYCDCLWRDDVDGLVSLFTENGVFKVEGLELEAVSRGRAALKKMYEKSIAELSPRLFTHNHIVDSLSETRAAAAVTSRCTARNWASRNGSAWVTTTTST